MLINEFQIITDLLSGCDSNKYSKIIRVYESTDGNMSFLDFNSELSFLSSIAISYKEVGDFGQAILLVKKIAAIIQSKPSEVKDIADRKQFLFFLLAEIYYKKKQIVHEYASLKRYFQVGGADRIFEKRFKDIRLIFLKRGFRLFLWLGVVLLSFTFLSRKHIFAYMFLAFIISYIANTAGYIKIFDYVIFVICEFAATFTLPFRLIRI